jgi:hypothetical protein
MGSVAQARKRNSLKVHNEAGKVDYRQRYNLASRDCMRFVRVACLLAFRPTYGYYYLLHTSATCSFRAGLIDWLNWLKNVIGFDSWRFDFVKGYGASYIQQYIDGSGTEEALNVGEYWADMA